MTDERPPSKRLEPLKDTARRLFLLSGNQCAFPDCRRPMVDDVGNFVGQVAHIEGVRGERFNPSMSNEDRRSFENLLLLCYPHHVATDDEAIYDIDAMRTMKANHEARFAGVEERILAGALVDLTTEVDRHYPENLRRMDAVFGWGLDEAEQVGSAEVLRSLVDRLAEIPPDTRSVLSTIVKRGRHSLGTLTVPAREVASVLGIGARELHEHMAILQRYRLAGEDEDEGVSTLVTFKPDYFLDGWDFWVELRTVCERLDLPLDAFINDLRFDLLDE